MIANIELSPAAASSLPLSLIRDSNVSPSLTSLPELTRASSPAVQADTRHSRIAALRRQIAAGTYRVSSLDLAECLLGSILTA